jgi:hypothetical protein
MHNRHKLRTLGTLSPSVAQEATDPSFLLQPPLLPPSSPRRCWSPPPLTQPEGLAMRVAAGLSLPSCGAGASGCRFSVGLGTEGVLG